MPSGVSFDTFFVLLTYRSFPGLNRFFSTQRTRRTQREKIVFSASSALSALKFFVVALPLCVLRGRFCLQCPNRNVYPVQLA
jgi:hypothetical protein